jgi:Ca2+-binding RTX toxin-like protein
LFNAEFKRAGSDLILKGDDGKTATVHDYFASDKHPTLLSPEGAALAPDVVAALAGPLAAGQDAQAAPAQANAQAVGRVATASGNATIVRNGVAMTVHAGDAVLKGDVLQTGSGTLGVTFNDGSTLNLTANARMVVNEFIYDPNGHANSEILSLVQGTFTAISGHVAHSGDMKVVTPVATMGIRGTVFGGTYDGTLTVYCVQSEHGVVLTDSHGNLLGQVVQDGPLLVVRPVGPLQVLAEEVQKTPQELATELSELQHIINVQTIGQQIIQQYFQQDQHNPDPQSNDHPHTQFQIDVPNNGQNSNSGDTGDTGNTANPDNATVHVTTTTTDQSGNTTATDETTYTVPIPPNLPPINFAPLQQTVDEDQPLVFNDANVNRISVFDPDTAVLTVMVMAAHGTFSLSGTAGLNFTVGDGLHDASMTFSGSQTDINAALDGLTFNPDANFNGPASLTIETNDGNASSGLETVAITVDPVPDPPTAGADNVITNAGLNTPFQIPNWALLANDTDPDSAPSQLGVTGVANAHGGLVSAGANAVTFFSLGIPGQVNSGSFEYTVSDGSLTGTGHVTVSQDAQGALDGSAGADILIGKSGGTTINGNDGNDVLIATSGNNTLTGGAGLDTFVFKAADDGNGHQVLGHNVVTDFHPDQDFLSIDHAIFQSVAAVLASAQDVAGGAVITANDANHGTITLNHVTVADLNQHQDHILIG